MKLAGLTCVALVVLAASSASAQASARCTIHAHVVAGVPRSHVVSVKGEVVVYRVHRESEQSRTDTLWVCERQAPRAVRIGVDESLSNEDIGEGHIPNKTLEHVQIAGPWVLATQTQEEDEGGCFKYEMSVCNGPRNTLVIANAAVGLVGSGASIRDYLEEPTKAGYVKTPSKAWIRTLLSPSGAVAWLEESGSGPVKAISLYGCLASASHGRIVCPTRTHAEGAIEPGSVGLSGTTLTWMAGASAETAAL